MKLVELKINNSVLNISKKIIEESLPNNLYPKCRTNQADEDRIEKAKTCHNNFIDSICCSEPYKIAGSYYEEIKSFFNNCHYAFGNPYEYGVVDKNGARVWPSNREQNALIQMHLSALKTKWFGGVSRSAKMRMIANLNYHILENDG